MKPTASRELRAIRDLLRRRMPCTRTRAERLTPVQQTNSQYNMPEIGKKIAHKANRTGVAERFADPADQKSIEVDLALIDHYDRVLNDLELSILNTTKQHDAQTLYLLQTLPGIEPRAELMITGNVVHPKATLGGAPPFGLVHRPRIDQKRGRLGHEDRKRPQGSIFDGVPGILPLPVIRKGGHLVVQCLHEVIKRQRFHPRPSASDSGGKSATGASSAGGWQLGTP